MTERVALRPVTEEDLDHLDAMFDDPEAVGEFLWGGFTDPRKWRKLWADNGLLSHEKSVLMISVDGERAGFVSWGPIQVGTVEYCWEIGITLWPSARGRGHGAEAQRQLVRYLFSHTTVNRIQALTDADNTAEQRALEKAGFTREGVLRGYRYRGGAWHDEVIYGVVRSDVVL